MKRRFLLSVIVGVPLLLGFIIVGYWYWVDVVHKKPPLPSFGVAPPFSLIAEDSSVFTNNRLMGKVTIADFIFTTCAGACPFMSSQMAELQKNLMDEPKVQLLSISVDPETDTPPVLAEYGKQYGAVRGKWIFLTGDKGQIFRLAREGFHLAVNADTGEGGGILHSQKFVLIDDRSAIRGYYDSEDSLAMSSLLNDTKRLTIPHR